LTNEFVSAVIEDRQGNVWAATNRGLFRSRAGRFERVDEDLHLPNIAFFALYERRDGTVLAAGPPDCFTSRKEDCGRISGRMNRKSRFFRIGEARDGSLWLGTFRGIRTTGTANSDGRLPQVKEHV